MTKKEYSIITSNTKKYIYFKIPKCATRTIKNFLLGGLGLEEEKKDNQKYFSKYLDDSKNMYIGINPDPDKDGFVCYRIANISDYKFLSHNYEDYFTFSFVRNPWDRLVSLLAMGKAAYGWKFNPDDPECVQNIKTRLPDRLLHNIGWKTLIKFLIVPK